jgi:hypothetical protein
MHGIIELTMGLLPCAIWTMFSISFKIYSFNINFGCMFGIKRSNFETKP